MKSICCQTNYDPIWLDQSNVVCNCTVIVQLNMCIGLVNAPALYNISILTMLISKLAMLNNLSKKN